MCSQATAASPAELAELVLSVSRRLGLLDQHDVTTISLSPLEAMLMRHIAAEPGTTPSRIAGRLGLKSSNASAVLRDLEARGFVQRRVDAADARSVRVYPTSLARENLDRKREHWSRLMEPYLRDVVSLAAAVHLLAGLDAALEAAPTFVTATEQE